MGETNLEFLEKLNMLLDAETRAKAKFLERFSLGLIEAQGEKLLKGKKKHIYKKKIKILDPVIESLMS